MIIRCEDDGRLLVVRQKEHALASYAIAKLWRKPQRMSDGLWERFLEAVRCHDDGWQTAEKFPAIDDAGMPHDFLNFPVDGHIGVWRENIERAASRDLYQALLIARHSRWLYKQFAREGTADELERVQTFVIELDQLIADFRTALGRSNNLDDRLAGENELLENAGWLFGFFDYISLAMLEVLPFNIRTARLMFGDKCQEIILKKVNETVNMNPWPFDVDKVETDIEVVYANRREFSSVDDFLRGIEDGEVVVKRLVLSQ